MPAHDSTAAAAAAAFSLETPDLSELLALVVSHNSKGRRQSWFLQGVELAHVPSGTRYSWRVAAWYVHGGLFASVAHTGGCRCRHPGYGTCILLMADHVQHSTTGKYQQLSADTHSVLALVE
jgi:hypothetical protein